MKLFEVNVEANAYVWANDYREAERILRGDIREVMEGADFTANEQGPNSPVWADWVNCLPFGTAPEEYRNMTVGEISEKMAEDGANADATLPLFPEG